MLLHYLAKVRSSSFGISGGKCKRKYNMQWFLNTYLILMQLAHVLTCCFSFRFLLNILFLNNRRFYCRAMRCISAPCAIMLCLSVCVSVTFVSCVKTNKDIFEIFSPSGNHIILDFLHQTGWRCSDGNSPNRGVECRWGRQKSRFWAYMPAVDAATGDVL